MTMLLAEDLLLLLLDDVRGSTPAVAVDEVLGGAVLTELALAGAVEVLDGGGWGRAGRVVLTPVASDPAGPAADPVLGPALTRVGERPRTAESLVELLGRGLRPALVERLAGRGLIRRQDDRVLGLFPRTRWPAADVRYEAGVRQQLADVLVRGVQPDPRTVALVALLQAVDQVPAAVDHTGLTRGEVTRRAKALAQGAWAADAVRRAVEATTAAMVAVMVATTAATSSS